MYIFKSRKPHEGDHRSFCHGRFTRKKDMKNLQVRTTTMSLKNMASATWMWTGSYGGGW